MKSSHRCDFCNTDVHRASPVKHLGSKKHSENITQADLKTPEVLYREKHEPIKKKMKKV